jgi:hypothetical protein
LIYSLYTQEPYEVNRSEKMKRYRQALMFDAATRRSVGDMVARGRLQSQKKRTAFEGMENSLGLKLNSA